ncbi:MAG: hypothetical protein ACR2PM_13535, partial [Hyphomicrobiales bacterium]
MARAEGRDEEISLLYDGAERNGRFLGIDEDGNMLLKTAGSVATSALPLIATIERFDEAGLRE